MTTTPNHHGHTLTILMTPEFERGRPPKDATIWRVSLSASRAFTLLCDIGHLYPSHVWRPRVGAMLEQDGAWTLYCWPRADPDTQLMITMSYYGATRLADASRWHGQAWLTGDLLYKVLAVLSERATHEQKLPRDAQAGYLLSLDRQGKP